MALQAKHTKALREAVDLAREQGLDGLAFDLDEVFTEVAAAASHSKRVEQNGQRDREEGDRHRGAAQQLAGAWSTLLYLVEKGDLAVTADGEPVPADQLLATANRLLADAQSREAEKAATGGATLLG
ncbi:hypothetical protein [Zeimonas arvi]|uniref:Uncharacterized protein n=1 Tax=Zeimonas arvi TaxID=2498847 RepID=A0A5C8NR42_9BURK|nr:hypothetical protein [Zeimonas arvi]TXL63567.1 hypothetical protein FHP08_17175 [Zeimonas arvi]